MRYGPIAANRSVDRDIKTGEPSARASFVHIVQRKRIGNGSRHTSSQPHENRILNLGHSEDEGHPDALGNRCRTGLHIIFTVHNDP